ncbi:NAD-dependent epimerase/dehydratase family protein [Roseateles koreensis]|uniref:NAD-dependent epimerase/dehydratase family protein n=1 Tax=Roseateles koreensis TaxID=2987526 RepID=A0ABT5KNU5_9BURK|nr:NAD-dependent epimerase/dehydratase family protein [Roseateles koreensis]MDC8784100.1 NAD-dependent epimerase/dehydratase family protein [Roseateles koreensis]
MRILLTGATGFLGSALAHHWHAQGHVLMLPLRPASHTWRIAALLPHTRHVQWVRVQGQDELPGLVESFAPEAVVHTACTYGRLGETALNVLDANVRFGMALLEGVLRLNKADPPCTFLNTGTVLAPEVSLYALSKTQFSHWGAALAEQHPAALQFINIRLQQMYGPGDDRSKFTTHILESCRRNEARLALTPGEQRRDMIHVADVVSAYDCILQQHRSFAPTDTIDVGSGLAPRVRDFAELAKQLTLADTLLDFGAVPYRANEAMHCVADTTRLGELGWRPAFDLESGLRHTLEHSPATARETHP